MLTSVVVSCGLSNCDSWTLEPRLSNSGTWACLLQGTWDPPGSGINHESLALAGRFFTTEPPGKPHIAIFRIDNPQWPTV